MHRQPLNKAAAFNTTNGGTPMVFGKGIGQPCAKSPASITPEVFFVISSIHLLFKIKGLHRHIVLAVGQSHQDMGHGQGDIARVFRFPEGFPLGILHTLENFGHIPGFAKLGKTVKIKKLR